MFEAARDIVIASFPPDLSPAELREQLLIRFYGDDFSKEELERIKKKLSEI